MVASFPTVSRRFCRQVGVPPESRVLVYECGMLAFLLCLRLSDTTPCKSSFVLGEHTNSFSMVIFLGSSLFGVVHVFLRTLTRDLHLNVFEHVASLEDAHGRLHTVPLPWVAQCIVLTLSMSFCWWWGHIRNSCSCWNPVLTHSESTLLTSVFL